MMNYERTSMNPNFVSAEADWGIEETSHYHKRFDSSSTSEISQANKIRDYTIRPPVIYDRHDSFNMGGSDTYTAGNVGSETFSNARQKIMTISPTTENFRKFIAKYLSLQPPRASMVEKFKYNLVLSNLLDDTLVLSKNDQALKKLFQLRQSDDHYLPNFLKREFNDDGIVLKVINKKYSLLFPSALLNPGVLINTVALIIFLLKQKRKSHTHLQYASQVKLFKILLIVCTRILKSKRAQAIIESSLNLGGLDDFMISNCKINKVLIGHIITLKEFDLFKFLDKNPIYPSSLASDPHAYSKILKKHLDSLLTCLLLNMKHSIRELLPFSNGELLEKYCQINNVQVSTIYETLESTTEDALTLETLTTKLTLFNNNRRFFVCQLLTIHDNQSRNFFILTLCDHLNIDVIRYPSFQSSTFKSVKLIELFKTHTAMLDQLFALNEKFKVVYNPSPSADYANDDVLLAHKGNRNDNTADDFFAADSEMDLNNLIDKMSGIVTSLKYFKKYSRSIASLENAEEHEERLSIFGSFQSELATCLDMFGTCMSEYKAEYREKFDFLTSNPSSCSTSQRNSHTNEHPFNLKTFHTSATKAKKKHPSLSPNDLNTSSERPDRKSKRISTGLQLGLLTVVEDPRQAIVDRKALSSNMDDQEVSRNSYNQAALEALSKKMNISNSVNRFSMASANSNISGFSELIASTQITTEDDGVSPKTEFLPEGSTQGMTKAELEQKLEESFMRIYNLESENHELKGIAPTSETTENPALHEATEPLFNASQDSDFLRNLEKTLSAKPQATGSS